MPLIDFRTNLKRCGIELATSVETIDARMVPLTPQIEEAAILPTLPEDHAVYMRSGDLKTLERLFIAEMPHLFAIGQVENPFFAPANHDVSPGN